MTKNIKSIFFVLTLVMLLVTVGAVCAADDDNSTVTVDRSVSDVATVSDSASDTVAAEPVQTTSNNNVDTKTIEKDKSLKTASMTVEVNNSDELISAVNRASSDSQINEYIINMNDGNYRLRYGNTEFSATSPIEKQIIINGNGQTLSTEGTWDYVSFNNKCNISFNNIVLNAVVNNYNNLTFNHSTVNNTISNYAFLIIDNSIIDYGEQFNVNTTIINSVINKTIDSWYNSELNIINSTVKDISSRAIINIKNSYLNGTLSNIDISKTIIDDDTRFGEYFSITGTGQIILNDTSRIVDYLSMYNGTFTLESKNIITNKTNYGNLTIKNSIINSTINNYGTLIISDDTTFGENCVLQNNRLNYDYGQIIINDTSRIIPYLQTYNGTYTIENQNQGDFPVQKLNLGNLTIINSTLNSLYNTGNLTIINSSIKSLSNGGGLIEIHNSIIVNQTVTINNQGNMIIDNSTTPEINNYGNITINNSENVAKINNNDRRSNLRVSNSVINKMISINSDAAVTVTNSTLNSTISNSGTLIINDDNSYGDNLKINGKGTVIVNNTTSIAPYLSVYNGNYTMENSVIDTQKTNYKNLTINNSTVNNELYNYGTLTINDSLLNCYISNDGTLIIDENTQLGESIVIDSEGIIITNNSDIIELLASDGIYIKDTTIINETIDDIITNKANLTIINSTINQEITNYANSTLTLNNTVINSTITNNGILIIDDNCTFEDNFKLYNNGELIISDIAKIIPYTNNLDGTYTIENIEFNNSYRFSGNITLVNCTFTKPRNYNYGILTLKESTVNMTNTNTVWIANYGLLVIEDTTEIINGTINDQGDVVYGQLPDTINPTIFEGDNTIENMTFVLKSGNRGNLTLINCSIKARIINQGNLTLINCSLSNNNMTVSGSKTNGFLIGNIGNLSLINCIMENNTFNTTTISNNVNLYGAIFNEANGFINVTNSSFRNNSVGYCYIYDSLLHAYSCGQGSVIANNGKLLITNSTLSDNIACLSGGAIYNLANITIDNSLLKNNTALESGGAIYSNITSSNYAKMVSWNINNSNFTDNQVKLISNTLGFIGGGAIADNEVTGWYVYSLNSAGIINNCIFDSNLAYTNVTGIMGVSAIGSSILIGSTSTNITNSTFKNTEVTFGNVDKDFRSYVTVEDNIFINSNIADNIGMDILNNKFYDNSSIKILLKESVYQNSKNKKITQNNFYNNSVNSDTILINKQNVAISSVQQLIERRNLKIENNTYQNTTINDTIDLNIPSKIYTGEPITITGTYTINNPDNYDNDILDQNKFNVYINGELDQTVDNLEFTVTPTAGTMMVTIEPTISQTRKTQAIRATTLTNIVITPENYNEYIYEGVLIGVSKDTKIKFQGEFNDKDEITIDTSDIIIDGTDATFTNTIFMLDAENIIFENMTINNTALQYAVKNFQDNNIISNNDITLINTNDKATAIYNTASNTIISNNVLNVEALAGAVDWDNTEGGVANTQAILLLGGNKNTIQNNNINIKSTVASGYNTLEAITNNNGATNTLITQNNITISNAAFNYAIDSLNNVDNITITENTITVTGERYCDGIQAGNGATNILVDNNNITCICINTTELTTEGAITYGVIATSMGSEESENITITNNNIDITGTANYGIELYKVNKTEIHNNTITVNGPFSMGIGYAYSPNGNATQNTITTTGDSTTPINQITEEFQPENVGIRIQNGTMNVSITDNTITTSDVGGQDTTIHSEPDNVTIANKCDKQFSSPL